MIRSDSPTQADQREATTELSARKREPGAAPSRLRWYQEQAVNAVWNYLRTESGSPCVVLPTGSGKTYVIAELCRQVVEWGGRAIVLAHVKELLEQSRKALTSVVDPTLVGVYSAGLDERTTDAAIVVAGIQSVYRRAEELGAFQLVIVDEAHLIPPNGCGMYRQFLDAEKEISPQSRLVGLTATPYRLGSGWIVRDKAAADSSCRSHGGSSPPAGRLASDKSERPTGAGSDARAEARIGNGAVADDSDKYDRLLDTIVYEAQIDRLISDGTLSSLRSQVARYESNFEHVKTTRGDFDEEEVEKILSGKNVLYSVCKEIVEKARERNRVLIFCNRVESAKKVVKFLAELDAANDAVVVDGATPAGDRAEIVRRFRGETFSDLLGNETKPLKYVANVGVFTTGFDAPNVDVVALVRPTKSLALYQQMVGRGLRRAPEKKDCLVLDFAGNIMRHGPLDIACPTTPRATGKIFVWKKCASCGEVVAGYFAVCPACGEPFPRPAPDPTKGIERTASDAPITSEEERVEEYDVTGISFSAHYKKDDPEKPPTLQVEYKRGEFRRPVFEWLCPQHENQWARKRFERWWKAKSKVEPPQTTDDAVLWAKNGALASPFRIKATWKPGSRFPEIEWLESTDKPDFDPKNVKTDEEEFYEGFEEFEDFSGDRDADPRADDEKNFEIRGRYAVPQSPPNETPAPRRCQNCGEWNDYGLEDYSGFCWAFNCEQNGTSPACSEHFQERFIDPELPF